MKVTVMYWDCKEEHFTNVTGYMVDNGLLRLHIKHPDCEFETCIILNNLIKFGVRKDEK